MAKIAIVDLCFNWPPVGGSWVDIKNIAVHLRICGHEPVLFVPLLDYGFARGRLEAPLPFPVKQIPFSRYSYNFLAAPRRFKREIEAFGPDFVFIADGYFLKPFLVHALREYSPIVRFYAYEIFCIQNNRFRDGRNCRSDLLGADRAVCRECRRNLFPLLPGVVKLLKNRPQYFVFHEYLTSLAFLPVYRRLFRRFLKEARKVIAYNAVQKNLLREYHPDIMLVPSGVDTDLFAPVRRRSDGAFTIGLAGRFYEEGKGLSLALEALRALHSEGHQFEVLVASPQEIERRDEFVRYCGWYDREKLPDFYNSCDLVIVPSIWEEPYGITAVEALSCGTPVVASSCGALPTIVDEGETGYIFPRGNAGALADRVRNLLENPELARRMGNAAREKARREFRWDVIIEKYYLPLFENTDKNHE
ncbi:MAG: glycosyltransferase family 4 protein [Candidatus Tritonobacter lacicola]|nr:glycosyltransferase family 4 protein [Candidatus Tritonobacter lacicola]